MTDDKRSTLYDHYKDTCSLISSASSRRDRLTLWVLAALALLALEMLFPSLAKALLESLIKERLEATVSADLGLLGSVIWLALLILSVRHFQTAAYVERSYTYLHALEDRLNNLFEPGFITREGKSYLKDYPLFQGWLTFLYRVAVPALVLIIPTIKIWEEAQSLVINVNLLINMAVYMLLCISTVLYLAMIHWKTSKPRK